LACAWRPRGELRRWPRLRSRLDALYERMVIAARVYAADEIFAGPLA
jgi:hypothetical protein